MDTKLAKAIDSLFHPASISIIGASETSMYGRGILEYLQQLGYKGKIIPINPKRDQILGIKAYPSVTKVPDPIDIALIIVDRKFVLDSLKECAEKGIKSSIIITAGFREGDDKGSDLEEKLTNFAREMGHRIVGPNCAGLANIKDRIAISLIREEGRELLGGNVGFVSQSGALMMALTGVARDKEIGLNYIVSTGNECDLEVSDFIEYMLEDPSTKVVTAFVEGFKDVQKFRRVADVAIEKKKPMIVLKVGRSDLGKHAAASHTAHLTGSDSAYDALFKQKGIIRAIDTDELFEMTKIFSSGKLPKGEGIAILTSSGGTGSLTADLCGDLGLTLPELTGTTLDQLLKIEGLLTFGKLANPIDIRGQGMGIIKEVLPPILKDDRYSIILLCLAFSTVGPGLAQKIGPDIIELSKTTDKPIVVLWIGRKKKEGLTGRESGFELLERNGIPVFEKPLTCLRAIKALINWNSFLATRKQVSASEITSVKENQEAVLKIQSYPKGPLNEFESKKLISGFGIPITREKLATSVEEAKRIARDIGYPVVLKGMSHDIIHKTEAGIVALNIGDDDQLKKCYNEVLQNAKKYNPKAEIQGVLVQEMVPEGVEVIVGMSRDAQFGPVIMFGLGGTAVEVLKDVSFRVPPLTRLDAEEMIKEVRAYKILEGIRGGKMVDIDSIIDTIMKMSHLSLSLKDSVAELDINPLRVFEKGKGAKALDSLVITA